MTDYKEDLAKKEEEKMKIKSETKWLIYPNQIVIKNTLILISYFEMGITKKNLFESLCFCLDWFRYFSYFFNQIISILI